MRSDKQKSSGGASLPTIVAAVFIVLKLVGVEPIASWSWWFVIFVPFIASFAIFFGLFALLAFVIGTFAGGVTVGEWFARRRRIKRMMREDDGGSSGPQDSK